MKLHQLQAFVSVVEHGGIRAASRAMNLSQAALTKALRSLEEEAGSPLLTRTAKGVAPTALGLKLLGRARLVTRQFSLCEAEIRRGEDAGSGEVRAGLTPMLVTCALGPAFNRFRRRYAEVSLRIVEGVNSRVLPLLREGSLDFVIAADSGNLPQREFRTPYVGPVGQSIVVRADHPALLQPTAAFVVGFEWGLPSPVGTGANPKVDAMFEAAGAGVPTRLLLGDANVITALASRSDIVTMLPTRMLREPECAGLRPLDIPGLLPPDVDVRIVSRPDLPLTRPAAFLARCLGDALKAG